MYKQLGHYLHRMVTRKELWKDGDLWTAVAAGASVAAWTYIDPEFGNRIRSRFAQLLTVTSIVFGFASSSMIFYVQSTANWASVDWVQNLARKVVDWYVWTVFCLLLLLGYTLLFWAAPHIVPLDNRASAFGYGVLAFLVAYVGCLITNNTLTIWWSFNHRDFLKTGDKQKGSNLVKPAAWPRWLTLAAYVLVALVLLTPVVSWIVLKHGAWRCVFNFFAAILVSGVLALALVGLYGILARYEEPTENPSSPRAQPPQQANGDGDPRTGEGVEHSNSK